MPKYTYLEDKVPQVLLERLQAEQPAGMSFCLNAQGLLSKGEQMLSADLVEQLRAAYPFAGAASVQVRVRSTNTAVREAKRGKAQAMAARGWPAQAVADAAGVSPSQARLLGAQPVTVEVQDSPRLLWAGLAAIRQANRISQATIAARLGASPMHISNCEGRLASSGDPQDVEQYVEVLAALLGLRSTRLRKRALLAGAAITDCGVPDGTASQLQEDAGPST